MLQSQVFTTPLRVTFDSSANSHNCNSMSMSEKKIHTRGNNSFHHHYYVNTVQILIQNSVLLLYYYNIYFFKYKDRQQKTKRTAYLMQIAISLLLLKCVSVYACVRPRADWTVFCPQECRP